MATMNISLPDKMKEWVERQVATGRYANASDYVRDLVRRDEEHAKAIAELQREVDKGLASGISDKSLDEVFAEARRRGRAALKARDAA
ncbi:MAG: type II toxin-antitoxin system ParD family antitoxin [Devosia sp.]